MLSYQGRNKLCPQYSGVEPRVKKRHHSVVGLSGLRVASLHGVKPLPTPARFASRRHLPHGEGSGFCRLTPPAFGASPTGEGFLKEGDPHSNISCYNNSYIPPPH